MSENEKDWSNPLVVGFGTATAEEPPLPAQQHLDATDGHVVNPPYTVAEGDGTVHVVSADGEHLDDQEGFAYGTPSASDSGGNSKSSKSTSRGKGKAKAKASDGE